MRRVRPVHQRFVPLCVAALLCPSAAAAPEILDDFTTLAAWQVLPSDGVRAHIAPIAGPRGPALRLTFSFEAGSGFVVLRRPVDLELPQNYRFSFRLRGAAPPNNLEFKLVDPSGENVWWVNQRAYEFPADWRIVTLRARRFQFAWGPSGGAPLARVGAIEFAIAAAAGGRGTIDIDELTYEVLPAPATSHPVPRIAVSSGTAAGTLAGDGTLNWTSNAADATPTLTLDLGALRELGGLALDWGDDFAPDYDVALSADGQTWEPAAAFRGGNGGRDWVPLPEAEAAHVRVTVRAQSRRSGVQLRRVELLPPEFSLSGNAAFAAIARAAPPGQYPRYFLGRATPWTVVGVAGDEREALFDVTGAAELAKGGPRLEPHLRCDERLLPWEDAALHPALADGYLPIPSVTARACDLELTTTALADGPPGESVLLLRYQLRNRAAEPRTGALYIALRPFQVLPPWQELNITGGVARVRTITTDSGSALVNGQLRVIPWTRATAFGASTFAGGEIGEALAAGHLPAAQAVEDPFEWASAAWQYDFHLAPDATRTVVFAVPLHAAAPPRPADDAAAAAAFDEASARVAAGWRATLNRVELRLPPAGQAFADTFRATQAYILINADGPAIQPGSRTYERSWIRDGALTSTALLYTGHAEQVRAFLTWYSRYQYPGGKVPCVVDRRGPDPVPEHDSTGQLIYALRKYYDFTGDRELLARHLPHVVAGVDYLEALRNQRLAAEFRDGPPEKRVLYGLVPESISHEGYSAKPMHSYWDGFWTLRGLRDATAIAAILDRPDLVARCGALHDAFRVSLYESIALAMNIKGVDYIPGCAELGDFDATSTAIAVFPCGEGETLPEPARTRTFDRYFQFFCDRRAGRLTWENYTPYEVRLMSTFVRLGQPERAHALLDFFLADQSPPEWRQWAEIVWHDRTAGRFIGDLPHTWVGSDFLSAARGLFLYERESDDTLVLAAGVRPEWLTEPGVRLARAPTTYGPVSYTLVRRDAAAEFVLEGPTRMPGGGLVLALDALGGGRPERVEVNGAAHADFDQRRIGLRVTPARVLIHFAPPR